MTRTSRIAILAALLAVGYVFVNPSLVESAVSRLKTWGAGETLTASDLNAEFNNIVNNGEDLGWPATKAKDLDGQSLILDDDQDTHITTDTDDRIDFAVAGSDAVIFGHASGNTAGAATFDAGAFTATASTDIARLLVANTNALTVPSGTTAVATSLRVEEPNLTATGTVTSAVSLYIEAAPTEGGTNNYALWVDAGAVKFDATLDVDGLLSIASNLVHIGDTDNLIGFTTDTQTFQTGGSTRMDITDSGVQLGGANARVTTVLDEDNMASNSATSLATQQSIKAYVDNSSALPRSYLAGLGLSNDTDTDHDIAIAVGESRDAAHSVDMVLSSVLTKQIDATWAAGDDAGGMNDGDTVGADEWFHVFLLSSADGSTVDAGFDTSLTAAGLLADTAVVAAGLTKYRRIGSVRTDGSANIIAFSQEGDEFYWDDPPEDENNASPGTSANTATLSVPLGVKSLAYLNVLKNFPSGPAEGSVYVSSLDQDDEAPSNSAAPLASHMHVSGAAGNGANFVMVMSDTSSQIRYRTGPNSRVIIATLGYRDRRGRDD